MLGQIADHMFEGLFEVDKTWRPVPFLAESYEMSPDGLRYDIQLRQGIKFHNGKDFTAEDVAFSAERIRSEGSDLTTRFETGVKVEIVAD